MATSIKNAVRNWLLPKFWRDNLELRALLEITEAVNETLDLREVMGMIVHRVGDLVGVGRCSIQLVDQKSRSCIVLVASDNPQADMLEVELEKYPEVIEAVETKEPVVIEDIRSDPRVAAVRDVMLDQGYRSLLVVPLVVRKEVLGTLFLRASRETAFTTKEIRFCRVAAGASANALKNALLYQEAAVAAERHRTTGEKLRRVLDGTPDMIVATDENGNVTEFNRGAERVTGIPAAVALGKPFREVFPGSPEGGPAGVHTTDGGDRMISWASAPLTGASGEDAGTVWIGRDVTDLRHAERSLAQAERLSSLGEVVAGVAHELNNPLSGVLGYAQLIGNEVEESLVSRDLERIIESARRCQRIVLNLLSFSRQHPPEKKSHDLNACVTKVLDLKGYHLRSSNVETVLDLAPDLPETSFDFHQIEQVILNLINNAEQAIGTGAGAGRIWLRTRREGGAVRLEVEDNGPGVSESIRHRLFDPFFTTKGLGEGTGLGLSVSYGIAQEHGGRLELVSGREGSGACFGLSLPIVATAEDGIEAAEETPSLPDRPLEGLRVLVAEDEPVVLELFSRVLEGDGAQVTLARNGHEAWECLSKNDFDLVVTDLRMPGLDGRSLYERVVAERPDMIRRFVFATGDLVRNESLRFLEGLPNPILQKPLDVDTVRRVLVKAVGGARH